VHSLAPNEHVDPASGNLLVTATDLALPGPIPLAVTRIFTDWTLAPPGTTLSTRPWA
jgi:hypothetical protein